MGFSLEHMDVMEVQQKGRVAYWFPITLAVVGSVALLFGVFVAVLSIPEVVAAAHFNAVPASQNALYVGASTCFTCHGDRPWDWSLTLYTQTVIDPTENPQAVTQVQQSDQVQVVDAGQIVEAYTTSDTSTPNQNLFHQYYVIRTEDGAIVPPTQRKGVHGQIDEANLRQSMLQCNVCHTASLHPVPVNAQLIVLGMVERRMMAG